MLVWINWSLKTRKEIVGIKESREIRAYYRQPELKSNAETNDIQVFNPIERTVLIKELRLERGLYLMVSSGSFYLLSDKSVSFQLIYGLLSRL